MAAWILWLCAAGALVILELLTGTFYLLMIALGLCAGAAAAYVGQSVIVQIFSAAVIGVLATFSLNRSRFGALASTTRASDQNPNLDVGQSVAVDVWHHRSDGVFTARAMYRGALWDIESIDATPPAPGTFFITDMRGSCLLVTASPPTTNQ
jgi:membrane protein implicated in regulation of membrane protease activity